MQCYTRQIDVNNKIQITLHRKPTNQEAFLDAKSEHPRSLQNNIQYSQPLRLKTICSKTTEYDKNCDIIKQNFLQRQYREDALDEQIKKVDTTERKELFTNKEKSNKNRIPLSLTCNRTLPNISNIVNRNWNILQINTEFHGVFQSKSIIAFKRNKNLYEIIGGHRASKEKFLSLDRLKGKPMPCSATAPYYSVRKKNF